MNDGAMMFQAKIINPDTGQSADANFRIDTGADVSAICLVMADRIGVKPKGFCTIYDADGEPMEVPVFVVDMDIHGCRLNGVEVVGLDLSRSNCSGLIGDNILDHGVLIRDGNSWSFSIKDAVCASGETYSQPNYLLAGVFGLALGVAGTLLLTRK